MKRRVHAASRNARTWSGTQSAQVAAHFTRDAKEIRSPAEVLAAHRQLAAEGLAPVGWSCAKLSTSRIGTLPPVCRYQHLHQQRDLIGPRPGSWKVCSGNCRSPLNMRNELGSGNPAMMHTPQNQSNAFNELVAFQKAIFVWVPTMECKELARNVIQGLTSYDECEYTTRPRGIVFSEECLSSRRSTSSGDL